MTNSVESIVISLGNEPAEVLGFKTEEQDENETKPNHFINYLRS